MNAIGYAQAGSAEGFKIAQKGHTLTFPRDHASHPLYKTEWWYLTGHLGEDDTLADYGFQLTFFRSATTPNSPEDQVYLAHAAILDKRSGAFLHEERLNSDLWNADASTDTLDLHNGNWFLRMEDADTETLSARFSLKGFGQLHLNFTPLKAKTLFGENGYSRKGSSPDAASYYITFTRLAVEATLSSGDTETRLQGLAWMDHEISSSQLSEGQIGWNWTSLILDDGSELMAYVMRRTDGEVDPYSQLTLIAPDGSKTQFVADQFSWKPIDFWESPSSGGRYPTRYEIRWQQDGAERVIRVEPFAQAQEISDRIGNFVYWEGACYATDVAGRPLGLGYTELTGYTESLYGKF